MDRRTHRKTQTPSFTDPRFMKAHLCALQKALTRGIVSLIMANRSELYAIPALNEVANNGGDRINKKTQQLLRKFSESIVGEQRLVDDEISKASKSKSPRKVKIKSERSPGSPRTPKKGGETGKEVKTPPTISKKRKVVENDDDDEKPDLDNEMDS